MKKILFLIMCFSLSFSAKALEKEKLENVFYKINGHDELIQAYYLHDKDKPIYFLNPNLGIDDIKKEVDTLPKAKEKQLEYVTYANKIALEHKDNINYYLSMQKIVVNKLFGVIINWYNEKGEEINILSENLDIREKIEPNLIKPSFDNYTLDGSYNSEFELEDINKVLSQFEIVPDKNIVSKDGNKLKVILREPKTNKIVLKKIVQNGEKEKFYQDDNGQYYIDLGRQVIIKSSINTINDSLVESNVSIQVKSKNKFINKSLTLEFKDENSSTFTVQTNNYGFYQGVIPIGKYQVKVLNLPNNFKNTLNNIEVKAIENQSISISFDELRGNLFLKRSGIFLTEQGDNLVPLPNVIYDIYADSDINNYLNEEYHKGEKVASVSLNELGELNYSLPLGSYYIVERNSYPYIPFEDKYDFVFNQDNLNVTKNITTKHIPLKVESLNMHENDTWNLCYMKNGDLECLDSSDYYNIPFLEYTFILKRNNQMVEYNYNFKEEGTVYLDFDKFFKNESLEEKKEEAPNEDKTSKFKNSFIENNDKKETKSNKIKLPKTSSKYNFLLLNISLAISLYLFIKKDN